MISHHAQVPQGNCTLSNLPGTDQCLPGLMQNTASETGPDLVFPYRSVWIQGSCSLAILKILLSSDSDCIL